MSQKPFLLSLTLTAIFAVGNIGTLHAMGAMTEQAAEQMGRGFVRGAVRGLAAESHNLTNDTEVATRNLGGGMIRGLAEGITDSFDKDPRLGKAIHKASNRAASEAFNGTGEAFDQAGERMFYKQQGALGRATRRQWEEGGDMHAARKQITNGLADSFFKIGTTGLVLSGGYFVLKHGIEIGSRYCKNWLFAPKMLQQTSKLSTLDKLMGKKVERKKIEMYFSPEQEKTIMTFAHRVKNTIKRIQMGEQNIYLPTVFFEGPPGSGKTMLAEYLAYFWDTDFVLINGASLSQFKSAQEAIQAYNELFEWKSNKKVFIYFDEVDSMLPNKQELKSDSIMVQVINHFLGCTGSPSREHIVGMSSNYVEVIEGAVLDRCDDFLNMGFPDFAARKNLLAFFLNKTFFNKATHNATFIAEAKRIFNDVKMNDLAEKTEGYSNRSLEKFINMLYTHMNPTQKAIITNEAIQHALDAMAYKIKIMDKARAYAAAQQGHAAQAAKGSVPAITSAA